MRDSYGKMNGYMYPSSFAEFDFEGVHAVNIACMISRFVRLASAVALCVMMIGGTLLLSSCTSEPEIARPLPEADQSQASKDKNEDAEKKAEKEQAAKEAAEAKAQAEAEAAAAAKKHEGPYVVAIRNGAGVDGLAANTQVLLESAGLGADTHTYNLGTYLAAGGLLPTTTVFVTGEGDDAADVKAEAEKIVAALGYGTVEAYNPEVAGEPMDGVNMLLIVGQDSLGM